MPTESFLGQWHTAAITSLGLFWMAFWAFGLGYLISSMIQVLVSRERMRRSLGEADAGSVALATGFGLVSSSCSFAALATTRALFAKGAGLVPSLAFLLASTNLVIELGIVIAVFLGWQFVVGEYVGGLLLILVTWLLVTSTASRRLVDGARERARDQEGADDEDVPDWRRLITSKQGWHRIATRYVMEWSMVWKDVTIGFTVAGAIAAFVPATFFHALFVGAAVDDPAAWQVGLQAVVGPLAAFFTFIGSMGNVPLAAVLFGNGVGFAGVMAFLFSDLVVFPVLRIQATYYGWRMALYVAGVFLTALVVVSVLLHYVLAACGLLPDPSTARRVTEREWFAVDYTLWLDGGFVLVTIAALVWRRRGQGDHAGGGRDLGERVLIAMVTLAFLWLLGGLILPPLLEGAG